MERVVFGRMELWTDLAGKFFLRVHERFLRGVRQRVVAVCDARLLGKRFASRGLALDLKAHRAFYEGERVGAGELCEALRDEVNVNFVGEECIAAAARVLPISLRDAIRVGGVPHVQYYKF